MADSRTTDPDATKLPFWIHQIAEYGIALVTASAGARTSKPAYPIVAAVVILVLAATADGPFAAFRTTSRKTHRIADLSVASVLIVVGLVLRSTMGPAASTVVAGVGVLLVALSWRTSYRSKPVKEKRVRRARAAKPVAPTPAPAAPGPKPEPTRVQPTAAGPTESAEPTATATEPAPTPTEPQAAVPKPSGSKPAGPIIGNERAESIGRGAGRVAAGGVRAWRARKGR
jgi:hypothetical protein